jgi:TPR repeat protein
MRMAAQRAKIAVCIITQALLLGTLACGATAATGPDDAARSAWDREDYAAAAALYGPRASAGDADAQYRMGLMARFGWGMDKDTTAAVRWLRRAADQGHAQAQAELGTMIRLGRGVEQDAHEAARLLLAAAAAGVGIAQLSIGRMYRDGVGVDRDLVEAYAWFSAAAANNLMDGLAYRSEIVKQMNPGQIAEGQRRAAERTRKETQAR